MSNVVTLPKRDDLLDQASDWLAKVDRDLTDVEERELKAWLGESAAHRETFIQMAKLWDKMDSLSRLADLFPQPIQHQETSMRARVTIAASLLIALLVGIMSIGDLNIMDEESPAVAQQGEQYYETNTGEQSTVVLTDGSTITLNTNSAIRTHFTEQQRALFLERGEVHFQVQHDEQRPFNVYIDDKMVQAVGTAFNLEITENKQIELIVTEGKVIVAVIEQEQQRANPVVPVLAVKTADMALEAGEQVVISDTEQSTESIESIKPEEINVKLSWRDGNLVFRGESLDRAINEIERYTPVQFEIVDEQLKKVRIAGLFKAGDVEGLLTTLQRNFNVRYQRLSEDRILLSSALSE